MSTRDWIEVSASLLGGAGIGAALMYLFDPQLGEERRAYVAERAGDAASATGEALGGAASTVSSEAGRLASAVSHAAKEYWSGAQEAAGDAADSARGYWKSAKKSASRASNSASDWLSDTGKRARGWVGGNYEREHHSALGLTAGAIGALALGAGIMFILDPAQGRRRRALIRDKAYSAARQSADYAQSTGRHLANKATGWAHQAQSMAGQVKDKMTGGGAETTVGSSSATPM